MTVRVVRSNAPAAAGVAGAARVAPLRHLGRWRLVGFGVNSVIGGGIFILPAEVAGLIGPAGIFAYVVAGLVVIGVGLALAALASRHDASGGPYLYVHRAFGEFAGFQVGWLFFLARLTAMAGLVNGFGRYLGAQVPWAATPTGRAVVIAACSAVIMGINMVGIRQTSGAANLFTIAKIVPLVLFALAGVFYLHPGNYTLPPLSIDPAAFLRAVLLLIFAFSGFETLTVPAEESLSPRRDMPFALITTILTVCAIYLPVHLVAAGMLDDLPAQQAPLATAAGIIAGPGGRLAMTLVAATSMAGCALISLVGGTRLLYSVSSARQVPGWLGALHPRWRTPAVGTILMGTIGTALAIASVYNKLVAVSAGTRLLVYLTCCAACLRPGGARSETSSAMERSGPGGRIIPVLTCAAIVALLSALKGEEIAGALYGIGVGTVLYLGMRWLGGRPETSAPEPAGGTSR